jgi:hypothetical protein
MTRLGKDGPHIEMVDAWITKASLMELVHAVGEETWRMTEFSEFDAKTFERAAASIRRKIAEPRP